MCNNDDIISHFQKGESIVKNMTKILALVLASLMIAVCFVGCGTTPADTTSSTPNTSGQGEDEILDGVPADLDYSNVENNTVTFFTRTSEGNVELFDYEICCDSLMKDPLYDAIHYRNIDVENRLGVKIKQLGQAGGWSVAKQWFETLSTAVNTNSSDFDAAAIYSTFGAPYALQNLYYNLNEVTTQYGDGYIDLEKPWWNQSVIDGCSLYGSLYFLGGDIAVSGTYGTHLIWFNKDLFNEKFPDEGGHQVLYDMVDNDTWTIDKMAGYVAKVWDDVNTSGIADDGDTLGFKYFEYKERAQMESWMYALDVEMLERDIYGEYSLANFATRLTAAHEKVSAMYNGEGVMTSQGTRQDDESALGKGNVLFQVGGVNDGDEYRQTTVNYGALPMPKFDEDQEDYGNGMWSYATFLTILNNLPEDRAKMVSAVFEVMNAESYKSVTPAYYDKVITGVYAKEEADSRMLDIAVRTCRYSFQQIYLGDSFGGFFNSLQTDPQTIIDANYNTKWPTALEGLLTELENIA